MNKNQEIIFDELMTSIRAKRKEFDALQLEVNKLLDIISNYQTRLEVSKKALSDLDKQRSLLTTRITELNNDYKKQLNAFLSKEADLSLKEKGLIEVEVVLSDRERKLSKEQSKLKEDVLELKLKNSKLEKDKGGLIKDRNNFKLEQSNLFKQKQELDKVKLEYQDNFRLLDARQNLAIKNLEKSEELKNIVNNKVTENDLLRIKLNGAIKENEQLKETLRLSILESITKKEELSLAIKSANDTQERLELKIEEQETMDREIEIRRLRVEKLIRDKGVTAELKALEEELKR